MRSRNGRNIFMDYIDVHAHGFPESYLRELAATYPAEVQVEEAAGTTPMVGRWSRAPLPAWSIERHLERARSPYPRRCTGFWRLGSIGCPSERSRFCRRRQ